MKIITSLIAAFLILVMGLTAQASIRVDAGEEKASAPIGMLWMATSVLGGDIYNLSGHRIAHVQDLIADRNGHIRTVIIAHGGFLGIGRTVVALDYAGVSHTNANYDALIAPLSEEMLKNAPHFSYDGILGRDFTYNHSVGREVAVDVDPSAQLSVAGLLGRTVIDSEGRSIGRVHDLSFRSGFADTVTIVLDEEAGPVRRVSVLYKDLVILRQGPNLFFQWPGPDKL